MLRYIIFSKLLETAMSKSLALIACSRGFAYGVLALLLVSPLAAGQSNGSASAAVSLGLRDLSEAEAELRQGQLTVWVPRTFVRGNFSLPGAVRSYDYHWEALQEEFKSDFPNSALRFLPLDRDEFIRMMHSSPEEVHFPDVAFIDNYYMLRPFLKDGALVEMWGPDRFGDRGWWVVFRQAENFAVGEAFLLWLAQSPHWRPWAVSTNSIAAKDVSTVARLAQEAVQDFANTDAQSLSSIMDPDAAHFQHFGPQGTLSIHSLAPLLTFGNSHLSFVLVAAVGEGQETFGLSHFGVVLRNTAAGWKVLLILPSMPLPQLEELFQSFDRLQLQEAGAQAVPNVTLLAPAEHAHLSRFPRPEIEWSAVDASIATYVVESQRSNPGKESWTTSSIWFAPPASMGPSMHVAAPFGAGMQPHRWRVWAISNAGVVSISEWRVIDFTN